MSILTYVDELSTIHFQQDGTDVLTMSETLDEKTGRLQIILSGRMNHNTIPGFYDEVFALISVKEKITLDMSELTYIDPSGITALVNLQQQIEQKDPEEFLLLTSVPEIIEESFKRVGATDLLVIQ